MGPAPSTVKKKPRKTASNVKVNRKSGTYQKRIAEEGSQDANVEPFEIPASNVKSIEKSVVTEEGSRDSNGGSKKRKRYDAGEFKSRKSPRFQKQMGLTTRSAVKKKLEKSEKIGSTPLRRSERDGVVNLSDSSNDMVSDSHTSKKHMANATVISKPIGEAPTKQDANMVNDVEGADTTVFSESIGDILAKHDADATVLSEPIRDMLAIEEIASEQQDEVENVYSDQMGIPAANDLTPHIEYADGSHAVEDPNGTRPNHVVPNVRSDELGIPAGNCNQEKAEDTTPSVASPVSDHSMPAIPEIHNDSHLLQQPTEDRIQDQEGQADHTPMVEIEDDNMQNVEAIQVDQIIPEESSLNPPA
ncbi:hypothetical protein Tco_0684597 [Tanacetum coccineum]